MQTSFGLCGGKRGLESPRAAKHTDANAMLIKMPLVPTREEELFIP